VRLGSADVVSWQTSGVDEHGGLVIRQYCDPAQVSAKLRRELIDCWIQVSNAGGAVGFPFLAVNYQIVSPVADELIGGLVPACSRLLAASAGGALAGWVHLRRDPDPLIAHWGVISRLQTLPSFRGQGIGGALMMYARQVAREEMGLEQLHLAVRGGTGLERFYIRLGWTVTGRWPGALRLAPGDDRDEILMILAPL
jgi:GNAT superfamily N-acetyltransferase